MFLLTALVLLVTICRMSYLSYIGLCAIFGIKKNPDMLHFLGKFLLYLIVDNPLYYMVEVWLIGFYLYAVK